MNAERSLANTASVITLTDLTSKLPPLFSISKFQTLFLINKFLDSVTILTNCAEFIISSPLISHLIDFAHLFSIPQFLSLSVIRKRFSVT